MVHLSKRQKRLIFNEISILTDQEGWENDIVVATRVKKLGKLIGNDSIGRSKPLPELDFERLTPDHFLYLKSLEYQVGDIQKACGVSKNIFGKWLNENELTRKHISSEDIQKLVIKDSAKILPLKGEVIEVKYSITQDQIKEFIADHDWKESTKKSYEYCLKTVEKNIQGEITVHALNNFLTEYNKKHTRTKFLNMKSVLLKYLNWIGFEYAPKKEIAKKEKVDIKKVPVTRQKKDPDILEMSSKTCVKVGKGYIYTNKDNAEVLITLDHTVAEDITPTDIAEQIAKDFGGKVVKLTTKVLLEEKR